MIQNTNTGADTLETEMARFQGVWRQTGYQADGDSDAIDSFGADAITAISGNEFTVTAPDGDVLIRGTFTLDPRQTPKIIDWTDTFGEDAGKTFPAIYSLESDQLIFCATEPGQRRPTAFRTHKGMVMRTLQRVTR